MSIPEFWKRQMLPPICPGWLCMTRESDTMMYSSMIRNHIRTTCPIPGWQELQRLIWEVYIKVWSPGTLTFPTRLGTGTDTHKWGICPLLTLWEGIPCTKHIFPTPNTSLALTLASALSKWVLKTTSGKTWSASGIPKDSWLAWVWLLHFFFFNLILWVCKQIFLTCLI